VEGSAEGDGGDGVETRGEGVGSHCKRLYFSSFNRSCPAGWASCAERGHFVRVYLFSLPGLRGCYADCVGSAGADGAAWGWVGGLVEADLDGGEVVVAAADG